MMSKQAQVCIQMDIEVMKKDGQESWVLFPHLKLHQQTLRKSRIQPRLRLRPRPGFRELCPARAQGGAAPMALTMKSKNLNLMDRIRKRGQTQILTYQKSNSPMNHLIHRSV